MSYAAYHKRGTTRYFDEVETKQEAVEELKKVEPSTWEKWVVYWVPSF